MDCDLCAIVRIVRQLATRQPTGPRLGGADVRVALQTEGISTRRITSDVASLSKRTIARTISNLRVHDLVSLSDRDLGCSTLDARKRNQY